MAVLLMTRRPHKDVSVRPWDWVVGIAGSFLVLLVRPAESASAFETFGFGLQVLGMGLQILAKLALGRSFGIIAAHRGLVRAGAYRSCFAGFFSSCNFIKAPTASSVA